ncbi:hypothetical protein LJC59_02115 [Desulfovibrio sp. OttesenSCG-928-A18]|nr:hypothetical protein [Desulfovibrio sp. OttesenSCG-928-A18]
MEQNTEHTCPKISNGCCPEAPKELTTNDGLMAGEFESRYFGKCTIQLWLEGAWLAILLTVPFLLFIMIDCDLEKIANLFPPLGGHIILSWITGILGGTVFATKWFYKSVAHGIWSRDRVFWRLLSPLMSGALGVFAFLFLKGNIFSLINPAVIKDPVNICVIGFVAGLSSDSIMAALSSLSEKLFSSQKRKAKD